MVPSDAIVSTIVFTFSFSDVARVLSNTCTTRFSTAGVPSTPSGGGVATSAVPATEVLPTSGTSQSRRCRLCNR